MIQHELLLDTFDCLVTFVRVAITGVPENITLPPNFNWDALYAMAERHKLTVAAWQGVQILALQIPEPLSEKWYVRSQQALSKTIRFEHELNCILTAFQEAGVDYVLLKGVTLQKFWPQKNMREFSDHDILIREEQREKVCSIMLSLGYENERFGVIDDVYKKEPIYDVEIHFKLFEEHYAYAAFFQDVWNRALPVPGRDHEYQFNPIDFYLFFLFHFLKHAQCCGSGLRFYADLFLLQEKFSLSAEQKSAIDKVLYRYDLSEYVSNLYTTADCLFKLNGSLDDQTKEFFACGCAYGGKTQGVYNSMQSKGTKKYIIQRIFPPYRTMIKRFKFLKKMPFLLPFLWIYRPLHLLFNFSRHKRILSEVRDIKRFTGKEVGK